MYKEYLELNNYTRRIWIYYDSYTLPLCSRSRRKSTSGCMPSLSRKNLAERFWLRNSMPLPMYFERVGSDENVENGSKSNSSNPLSLLHIYLQSTNIVSSKPLDWTNTYKSKLKKKKKNYPPSITSSLNCKNSAGVIGWKAGTLTYSHTPGLGRIASAMEPGNTNASYKNKITKKFTSTT